jgi:hypothetical protein
MIKMKKLQQEPVQFRLGRRAVFGPLISRWTGASLSIGVTIPCEAGRSSQRRGAALVSPGGGDVAGEEEDGGVVGARGRPPPTEALRQRSHGIPGPHLLPLPHISTHSIKVAILFFLLVNKL